MASQSCVCGKTFQELREIIDMISDKSRIGVIIRHLPSYQSRLWYNNKGGLWIGYEEFFKSTRNKISQGNAFEW